MEAMTPRVLTRCLLRSEDLRPRFEGFEVIGAFNPAAVSHGDRVVLLIRVAERPREVRDQLDVYYGAADTSTGVARFALADLLAAIEPI